MATLDLNLIGKVNPGTNPQKAGMTFQTNAPLDDRCAVRNKASLISKSAFVSNAFMYPGMAVSVVKSGEMYILTNTDPTTITLYTDELIESMFLSEEALDNAIAQHWKKLASASDVSSLSGVFTFKGIAEAISPDQRIITTRGVTIPAVRNEQGTITKNREPLYCVTTAYEFDMDVYYGWGTSLDDIRFWTDTPTVNSGTTLYGKGEEMSVTACEFDGELYYPIDSTVAPTAGELVTPYESVGGIRIYITEDGYVYDNEDAGGDPMGEATLITYKGCDFSVRDSIALEENTTSETITASSNNSGHVYQIGENEYASNGQIWVKLGSPVEDWIVL